MKKSVFWGIFIIASLGCVGCNSGINDKEIPLSAPQITYAAAEATMPTTTSVPTTTPTSTPTTTPTPTVRVTATNTPLPTVRPTSTPKPAENVMLSKAGGLAVNTSSQYKESYSSQSETEGRIALYFYHPRRLMLKDDNVKVLFWSECF